MTDGVESKMTDGVETNVVGSYNDLTPACDSSVNRNRIENKKLLFMVYSKKKALEQFAPTLCDMKINMILQITLCIWMACQSPCTCLALCHRPNRCRKEHNGWLPLSLL